MTKPALPKGMRDYLPDEMYKRRYLIDKIRHIFELYNYQPVQTPAMETLTTLTEKYGEEGDQLLFRVLRSGDFVRKADPGAWESKDAGKLAAQIADKGLRYDLTVPLARMVSMHQHELQFPFKRYQVQPVWRADRPQKGRYREFYQFDGDVIGTNSIIHDTEMVLLFIDAFSALNLTDITIHLNNRRILYGLASVAGTTGHFQQYCTLLDKADKIGAGGVKDEMKQSGYDQGAIQKTVDFLQIEGDNDERIRKVRSLTENHEDTEVGLGQILQMIERTEHAADKISVRFSPALARGLDYYTGTIFEVTHNTVAMGSIAGGGRYDNLTGAFGLKDMAGIGISFGIERIYDIMDELKLFPDHSGQSPKVLAAHFGSSTEQETFLLVHRLRAHGINADMYPEEAKLKKQFAYADKAGYSHVISMGTDEVQSGTIQLKNMRTGEQKAWEESAMIRHLQEQKR